MSNTEVAKAIGMSKEGTSKAQRIQGVRIIKAQTRKTYEIL